MPSFVCHAAEVSGLRAGSEGRNLEFHWQNRDLLPVQVQVQLEPQAGNPNLKDSTTWTQRALIPQTTFSCEELFVVLQSL